MQSFFVRTTETQIRLREGADLGFSWTHMSEGTFSHVKALMDVRLIFIIYDIL